jgi:hypothetical protein
MDHAECPCRQRQQDLSPKKHAIGLALRSTTLDQQVRSAYRQATTAHEVLDNPVGSDRSESVAPPTPGESAVPDDESSDSGEAPTWEGGRRHGRMAAREK